MEWPQQYREWDDRLDKLEDLLKSCQLPTNYISSRAERSTSTEIILVSTAEHVVKNGHTSSECFRSSYGNPSWGNQSFSKQFTQLQQ